MTGFLEKAAHSARANVARWRDTYPDPPVMDRNPPPLFLPFDDDGCGIIAEVKRRSPSRGDLMGARDPLSLPEVYSKAGAAAVSIVVEERYFGGSTELFEGVREKTALPLLWKDFVVDPFQIRLAAALGASAVLLIAGMLSDSDLAGFLETARETGIRALVEIHDSVELERAMAAGADLLGVNNRDLVTLEVDLGVSEILASKVPQGIQKVSESGIRTPEDVERMAGLGYRAVLVGESLVTAQDAQGLLGEMVKAGKISF